MGIFKNITKVLKEAAPVIGAGIGMYYGGTFGAALGSGLGSLASGRSTEESLKNAALAGTTAYLAGGGKGFKFGDEAVTSSTTSPTQYGFEAASKPSGAENYIPMEKTSFIDKLIPESTTGKLLLGSGILGLAGGMGEEEKIGSISQRPYPEGKARLGVGLVGNKKYNLNNDDERLAYFDDIRKQQGITSLNAGGEVEGPGTGTSDSVPARLSDGEFVVTAKAVRGAGGGDRNVGAARMYDMMSQLERVA